MNYLDTSVLVAAFTNEANTSICQRWLGDAVPGSVAISDWVVTEFSAALSMKSRSGQLKEGDRAAAMSLLYRFVDDSFVVWPIARADFRAAARLASQSPSGLRAGDALHLAVAFERHATVLTLDRGMATAAAVLGVDASTLA